MHYTPHIDEFHIGFEYEYLENGDWVPAEMSELKPLDTSKCRVNYLNANDIINEGFDLIAEDSGNKIFRHVVYLNDNHILLEVHMTKETLPIVSIYKNEAPVVDAIMLKNKNEFKWLISSLV